MARQWATAVGWDATLTTGNAAVIAAGTVDCEPVETLMTLMIQPATVDEAITQLPDNIQTVGHAIKDYHDPIWARRIAQTGIRRFVPLARMHHFGPVWDGWMFWRQMFEDVELSI